MSNYVVGNSQTHYFSQGDVTCRCPKCYSNSVESIGVLNINGVQHNASKCTSCNVLFSGVDGGIASMIEEAKTSYHTQNVGFTQIGITSQQQINQQVGQYNGSTLGGMSTGGLGQSINTNIQSLPPVSLDYDSKSKLDNINYSIQNLMSEIKNLIQQNHDLMNKLQNDPLISIKKAVSEFNLK